MFSWFLIVASLLLGLAFGLAGSQLQAWPRIAIPTVAFVFAGLLAGPVLAALRAAESLVHSTRKGGARSGAFLASSGAAALSAGAYPWAIGLIDVTRRAAGLEFAGGLCQALTQLGTVHVVFASVLAILAFAEGARFSGM